MIISYTVGKLFKPMCACCKSPSQEIKDHDAGLSAVIPFQHLGEEGCEKCSSLMLSSLEKGMYFHFIKKTL